MKKGLRIGVDLGGTAVKAALVDERGDIKDHLSVPTVQHPRRLARAVREVLRRWDGVKTVGIGVGVAGDVDSVRGVVRFAPNLGWKNVPLSELLRREGVRQDVVIDNDANAAAWGAFHVEYRGRVSNMITLTLGTGVGGGLVFDGKLYRGTSGSAGEIGHMVVRSDGDPCACGGRGCLEAYAGGVAMARWARSAYKKKGRTMPPLDPKSLEDRALAGDRVAMEAYRRAGEALGTAFVSLVNVLNPEAIVLTGGVARGAPLFLPSALKTLRRFAFASSANAVRVRVARRPGVLGVAGAGLLAG